MLIVMARVRLKESKRLPHQFKPGQSGNPNGRRKGIPNKLTTALRDAIMQGADVAGSRLYARGKTDKDLAIGYYAWLAVNHPDVYGRLAEKLIPILVTSKFEHEHNHAHAHLHKYDSPEALAEAIKARGLPEPSALLDVTPKVKKREETDAD